MRNTQTPSMGKNKDFLSFEADGVYGYHGALNG
jgi:hypothetical protein